jgi:hypothetical protein
VKVREGLRQAIPCFPAACALLATPSTALDEMLESLHYTYDAAWQRSQSTTRPPTLVLIAIKPSFASCQKELLPKSLACNDYLIVHAKGSVLKQREAKISPTIIQVWCRHEG